MQRVMMKYSTVVASLAIVGMTNWLDFNPAHAEQLVNPRAVALNNEGTIELEMLRKQRNEGRAVTDAQWKVVFDKFDKALKLAPHFEDARTNLAIAHNNKALTLTNRECALAEFHRSLFFDSANATTEANLNMVLKAMGLNPSSFGDRVQLGDNAVRNKDWISAVIEYRAALRLRDDAMVHTKLAKAYRRLGDSHKAVVELRAARNSK